MTTTRPARYVVEWQSLSRIATYIQRNPDDPDLDGATPDALVASYATDHLPSAREFAGLQAKANLCTVLISERVGIHDVTPVGDPPGLIWDWDDVRLVDEVQPPEVDA